MTEVLFLQRCAAVHPLHLTRLCDTLIRVLSAAAGIEGESQVFVPLRAASSAQDLARTAWVQIYEQLRKLAQRPCDQLAEAVVTAQLFADRAVLHARLYRAKSGGTLQCLGTCALPPHLPAELGAIRGEFEQHLQEADEALKTGRALLDRFQREALLGEPIPRLRAMLEQAAVCFAAYRQALRAARVVIGYVAWYLSWIVCGDDLDGTHQGAEIRAWLSQHPVSQATAHTGTRAA